MSEVWRLEDLGLFQHLGFNRVGSKLDVEAPLLDFLGLRNHAIQLAD
jgi:hypothetical protein